MKHPVGTKVEVIVGNFKNYRAKVTAYRDHNDSSYVLEFDLLEHKHLNQFRWYHNEIKAYV